MASKGPFQPKTFYDFICRFVKVFIETLLADIAEEHFIIIYIYPIPSLLSPPPTQLE